jgi:prevent-host-death family protein
MKIAPLAEVKAKLSAYLDECKTDGPIVITRNGKPAGVLIYPANEEDLENIVFSRSPRLQALLGRSRRSIRDGKGLSEEDFWQAVEEKHTTGDKV